MVASEMTKFADDARVCLSCSTVGDPNRTGRAHFAMHARATTTPRSIAISASGRPLRRVDRVARVRGADSASLSSRARPSSRVAATSSESSDPSQWRVRQVYGDGKVLLDQLREVADLLADGFNSSGRSSRDLLNGLVQKVRARPSSVVAIEHSHPPTHPSARPAPQPPPPPRIPHSTPPPPIFSRPSGAMERRKLHLSRGGRRRGRLTHGRRLRRHPPARRGREAFPGGPRRRHPRAALPPPTTISSTSPAWSFPRPCAAEASGERFWPARRPSRRRCVRDRAAWRSTWTSPTTRRGGCTHPSGSRWWPMCGTGAGGRGGGEGRRGAHGQLSARVSVGGTPRYRA